jgi:hypothetical protein
MLLIRESDVENKPFTDEWNLYQGGVKGFSHKDLKTKTINSKIKEELPIET